MIASSLPTMRRSLPIPHVLCKCEAQPYDEKQATHPFQHRMARCPCSRFARSNIGTVCSLGFPEARPPGRPQSAESKFKNPESESDRLLYRCPTETIWPLAFTASG